MALAALAIAAPLAAAPPQSLHLLHSFDRAANFVAADGTIVALVTAAVGPGPFYIVVPLEILPRLPAATIATWAAGRFVAAPLLVSTAGATLWAPALPPLPPYAVPGRHTPLLTALLREARGAAAAAPLRGAIDGALQQRAATLRAALHAGDEGALAAAVPPLIGLGGGLTPAGDDLLLGLLAARWLRGAPPLPLPPLDGTTTTLSAAFLREAARGHFAAPWHRLRTALATDDEAAVRGATLALLAQGATSGADALGGFLLGWAP